MTYKEWVEKNGHIDHVVKQFLPKDEELDVITRKQLKEKIGDKIIQAAQELGIEITKDDLDEVLDRVHVADMPPFHKSHYDLHC